MSRKDYSILQLLPASDRELLDDALAALQRERASALQIAMKAAAARRQPCPDVSDFGLPDVLRMRRQLNWSAAHRPPYSDDVRSA